MSDSMNYLEEGQITVGKLIEMLMKQDRDALAWTAGCDGCWGAVDGVSSDEDGVLIDRCN